MKKTEKIYINYLRPSNFQRKKFLHDTFGDWE